jgi:hypothetical protein
LKKSTPKSLNENYKNKKDKIKLNNIMEKLNSCDREKIKIKTIKMLELYHTFDCDCLHTFIDLDIPSFDLPE